MISHINHLVLTVRLLPSSKWRVIWSVTWSAFGRSSPQLDYAGITKGFCRGTRAPCPFGDNLKIPLAIAFGA
jgi:hypothetical protein